MLLYTITEERAKKRDHIAPMDRQLRPLHAAGGSVTPRAGAAGSAWGGFLGFAAGRDDGADFDELRGL